VAAIGGLALACRVSYGGGFASYDPLWSLVWGRQLAHGQVPDIDALAIAPTPHPLANAVGAVGSLFGQGGPAFLALVGFLGFGLLGWAAFRLGRELFGAAVGVGFALLLLTSPPLVDEALQGVVDVPFLAFVLWAAALEARRPGTGGGPFILLGLAGLLRPEAWLLSAALLASRALRTGREGLGRWMLLVAVAPVLWLAFDLVATGDAFHSLHATRALGSLLNAPTGTGSAIMQFPRFLRFVLDDPLVWAGLAGLLAGLVLRYERALLPATLLVLGLAGFVVLGIVGLPLVYRYAFVPGAMVALFAAVALLGWTSLDRGKTRTVWMALAVPAAVVVIVLSAPRTRDDLQQVVARSDRTASDQRALRALLGVPAAERTVGRCGPILIRDFLLAPLVAYRTRTDVAELTLDPASGATSAVVGVSGAPPAGAGWRREARNGRWAVYARC
jgi:hypothetical protein